MPDPMVPAPITATFMIVSSLVLCDFYTAFHLMDDSQLPTFTFGFSKSLQKHFRRQRSERHLPINI
jgi:hypothetical protein